MSEILFEYMRQGTSVKVTAIEPETGTEAVVIVPASLSEKEMQAKAMQKLLYILKKKEQTQQ
jgi:predicted metal-dependent hydrolase